MNRSNNVFGDIVVYSFVVAGIFLMTNSNHGANLVKNGTHGYANIVQASTGQRLS